MYKIGLSCLFTILSCASFGTIRKVLFIGNSYTYTNNMPLMVQSIATAFGDTVIYDESDPGGYTLQQHTTNPATIAKIASRQWDVVIIHEQSEMPSFPPAQVMTDVYPYATRLDSMVHANDTCSQTMFLMTWGHANGDPANCAGYPAICTYDGMQQRLRESYMEMAATNHAAVAPVGMAFKIMMDSLYSPWLYTTDSSHPIVPGSYLEACVVYASLFHKPSRNCSYLAGLTAADAATLQRVADKVVFDSIALWQGYGHYPNAGFTHTSSGNSVIFAGQPGTATGYSWSFGDMGTDTSANPTHVYASAGTYLVTHTVFTSCFRETLTDTIHIGTTGVFSNYSPGNSISVLQDDNGRIVFDMHATEGGTLEVYDGVGRKVRHYNILSQKISDYFAPGLYIYRLFIGNSNEIITGKISVY